MESMRQQKMGRQIQKDLGDIFLRHGRDYFGNSMVTITEIEVTPDLAIASVHLSIFPNENTDQFFETLETKKNDIRRRLGNQMSKRARIIPDLNFYHDETSEHASQMDKLIDDLNIPPADDSK
jgi:ribosome-binding factor A